MTKIPTPYEIREKYKELLKHSSLLDELTPYEKSKLLEYAEKEKTSAREIIYDLINSNPDFKYPEQYKNGKEFEYWSLRVDEYRQALFVESLIIGNKIIEKDNSDNTPKYFEDLFINSSLPSTCLDALRIVQPRVINSKNEYLLGERKKGAITAWVEAMKQKELLNKTDDKTIANLINSVIINLDLGKDGRTLRNLHTSAFNKYFTQLLYLLPELPLSS